MKIIKSYSNFITESRTRSEGISLDDAVKMYKENCSDWDLNNPNQIYRATYSEEDYYYINPKGKYRVSSNTGNSYNSFFDVIPSWEGVPRRSESLIMSNNVDDIESFGDGHYVMIPFNGSRIGVCSESDIWDSMIFVKKLVGDEGFSMDDFDGEIQDLFKQNITDTSLFNEHEWNNYRGEKIVDRSMVVNRDSIIKLCDYIDQIPKEDINLKYSYGGNYSYSLIPIWINKYPNMKFIEFIDFVLDFKKNGFRVITTQKELSSFPSRTSSSFGRELWSDGEFLAIEVNRYWDFRDMVKTGKIKSFVK